MRRSGGLFGADVAARPLRSPYQITRAADSVKIALYAISQQNPISILRENTSEYGLAMVSKAHGIECAAAPIVLTFSAR